MEKMCRILENLRKTFIGKKVDFNFRASDRPIKKGSLFFWFFLEIYFRWKKCAVFWEICEKLFFSEKKSNFKFENLGYFEKKNRNPQR